MTAFGGFLAQFGSLFVVIGFFLLLPTTYLITGRYFDNTLEFKNKFYNPFSKKNILPGYIMRTGQYAVLIFFKKPAKGSYNNLVFGETNFRDLARNIDIVMSFLLCVFVYFGAAMVLLGVITNLLGKFLF